MLPSRLKSPGFLPILFITLLASSTHAYDKYAGEFLKFGLGVREMSLGGAMLAAPQAVTAPYWNAATLVNNALLLAQVMHAEEFAGILKFDHLALALPAQQSHALAISFFRIGVNDIPDSRRALLDLGTDGLGPGDEGYPGPDPDGTEGNGKLDRGERLDLGKIGQFGASQNALFIAFARQITPRLALGLTSKHIYQSLYVDNAYGLGFDCALLYQPTAQLKTALTINDFTTTFLFWRNGRREIILPSLRLGAVWTWRVPATTLLLRPAIALDWHFEGKEQNADLVVGSTVGRVRLGMELIYKDQLALRAGRDDLGSYQVGLGLQTAVADLDYGFAFGNSYQILGQSHRVALTFHLRQLATEIRRRV